VDFVYPKWCTSHHQGASTQAPVRGLLFPRHILTRLHQLGHIAIPLRTHQPQQDQHHEEWSLCHALFDPQIHLSGAQPVEATPQQQSPQPEMMDMAHAHPASQVKGLMVHLEVLPISLRLHTSHHTLETASATCHTNEHRHQPHNKKN